MTMDEFPRATCHSTSERVSAVLNYEEDESGRHLVSITFWQPPFYRRREVPIPPTPAPSEARIREIVREEFRQLAPVPTVARTEITSTSTYRLPDGAQITYTEG
jgi:hypothetical protein